MQKQPKKPFQAWPVVDQAMLWNSCNAATQMQLHFVVEY